MFEKTRAFFRWLFGGKKPTAAAAEEQPVVVIPPVAFRIKVGDQVTRQQRVCLFNGTHLLDVVDQIPAMSFEEGTTFWCVPREDVAVTLSLPLGEKKDVEATAKVRFEPEMGLGTFLESREKLELSELGDLLQSQLTGLLEILHSSSNDLTSLGEHSLESLRAQFSVLLSTNGFRCTGLTAFTEKERPEEPVETPENEAAAGETSTTETSNAETPATTAGSSPDGNTGESTAPQTAEVDAELLDAIKKVQTWEDWQALTAELHTHGLPETPACEAGMETIGHSLLEHKSYSECVQEIRQLAAQSVREEKLDTSRWNGLALRLRVNAGTVENSDDAGASPDAAFSVTVPKSKRPKRGWFFAHYVELDKKLQAFSLNKLHSIRYELERLADLTSDIRVKTDIFSMLKDEEIAEQLLMATPQLTSNIRDLRVDKKRLPGLLENMNQAVTSLEYLEALLKQSMNLEQANVRGELKACFATLTRHIQNRHATR